MRSARYPRAAGRACSKLDVAQVAGCGFAGLPVSGHVPRRAELEKGARGMRWQWQLLSFTAPMVAYSDQSVVWLLDVGLIDKRQTEPTLGPSNALEVGILLAPRPPAADDRGRRRSPPASDGRSARRRRRRRARYDDGSPSPLRSGGRTSHARRCAVDGPLSESSPRQAYGTAASTRLGRWASVAQRHEDASS